MGSDPRRELYAVAGARWGTAIGGFKQRESPDLALLALAPGSRTAAVFTRNRLRAAPVQVAVQHLADTEARALVVNSGNANAATGEAGMETARLSCRLAGEHLDVAPERVVPFSTGVIGDPLPREPFERALPACVADLSETSAGWWQAAEAMGTTDTRLKGASRRIHLDGVPVTVTGIAKGAGMIHPHMATLLAFVATDVPVTDESVRALLDEAVEESFNRISVDGDTSTNDALTLSATGQAALPPITGRDDPRFGELAGAITAVCRDLAEQIVRDGEGATRLLTLRVTGAAHEAEAEAIADGIARSPLVKTALFAADPNWGRILMAAGAAAPEPLDWCGVTLHLGEVCVVRGGVRAADYTEEAGQTAMAEEEVTLALDLGRGSASAWMWTCDLSYDYITINAEYRT